MSFYNIVVLISLINLGINLNKALVGSGRDFGTKWRVGSGQIEVATGRVGSEKLDRLS